MASVSETACMGNFFNRFGTLFKLLARFQQTQQHEILVWGHAGSLLQLTVQRAKWDGELFCQLVPLDIISKIML